jgi:hypothetical protein
MPELYDPNEPIRVGTKSESAPLHRWHCDCTRSHGDASAWGLHKRECLRCWAVSPFVATEAPDAAE